MSESTLPVEAGDDPAAHAARCENCATVLQGDYCHQCGQSAHNPLEHVGHAIEEVFESFWHLDGRIFRTLRQLFVPGRVAINYLAGHRVRYIPPLRLFVILSLLTFFIGKLVLNVGEGVRMEGVEAEIGRAQTIAEVEQIRDRLLAPIEKAEQAAAKTPGANPALIAARVRIQGEAASRIAELREQAAKAQAPADATDRGTTPADNVAPAKVTVSPLAQGDDDSSWVCRFNERPFDAKTNPVKAAWMPGFANRWLNARIGRGCENIKDADRNGERLFQQFLGAIPTALFLLMPLFALLLKLLYLGSGRTYLEHLVVALYSHGFLLLMLLALFMLSAASNAGAPAWFTGLGYAAIWIWMPIYLLLMQKRVYRGGWFTTVLRYVVIGTVYMLLVSFATLYAALIGISS
ncbi:MAG TPA: DUF3667 domain-containing protein [Xanthomonadaceae bacterium]|nr:DUF3667 domain-containing protein [Xanthomonadaceae bacterium]